jgi:hypothetical protein
MRRAVPLLACPALVIGLLAACSHFGAVCPAIAYVYTVEVQTDSDVGLAFCIDDECLVADAPAPADEEPTLLTPDSFHTPGEQPPGASIGVLERTADGFRATLNSAPEQVELRALDTAGGTVSSRKHELEWTRTGGSEACGGPAETPPLAIDAPA